MNMMMVREQANKFRVFPWFLIGLIGCFGLGWAEPQQLAVLGWKLTLASTAGYCGYWLDRSLFPRARPQDMEATDPGRADSARLRRAVVVAAFMITVGLGL